MNICSIDEEGRYGGPQRRTIEVAKEIKKLGIQTTVYYSLYDSEKYKIAMDWDLWIRAAKSGFVIRNLPEYLCYLRIHALQATSNKVGAINLIKEKVTILKNSKDIINDQKNINAYKGWKFYYDTLYYLKKINKNNNFITFFFAKKRIRGLFEFIKLIIFHKIINKPNILYITAVQYKKI